MIIVLTGNNSFELQRRLVALSADFDGEPEVFDGADLELRQLPDLLMGGTLFATKRFVIMKRLSENKAIWNDFGDWLERVSDDVQLVLVEPSLDKRTKTYKALQKQADIQVFAAWADRDRSTAVQWVVSEIKTHGGAIDRPSAQRLVDRVGVDQWLLYHALQKLAVLDQITPGIIDEVIEAQPSESAFALFESALRGERESVARIIATLSLSEDAYMTFGLLSGQAFQLAALAHSEKSSAQVASDIKAHPFAVSKLTSYAKQYGKSGVGHVIRTMAECDLAIKSSGHDPWLLVERALLKLSVDPNVK
ncbi:MAG: DNA polymerase III subunit delta [Candidatus Saccharimonadales bacterium]